MTTYGEEYDRLLTRAKAELMEAADASTNGDIWEASIHLTECNNLVSQANDLLHDVSKAAFSRVMQSRDGSR